MKIFFIISLLLSIYNVRAQTNPCPCNPRLKADGKPYTNDNARCQCYTCLDHKPWKAKDESLIKNERSTKQYAPVDQKCPNVQNEQSWDHIEDYQWINEIGPGENGYGYQPNAIVYERSSLDQKWEAEIDKMIRVNHITGIKKNPCKSKKQTFALCWYHINGKKTQEKITSKAQKIHTAHTMDDIYYDQYKRAFDYYESDSTHSTRYNYISEYLIGIELILIIQIFMVLICCILGIICGYALKRVYDFSRNHGKDESDRDRMD